MAFFERFNQDKVTHAQPVETSTGEWAAAIKADWENIKAQPGHPVLKLAGQMVWDTLGSAAKVSAGGLAVIGAASISPALGVLAFGIGVAVGVKWCIDGFREIPKAVAEQKKSGSQQIAVAASKPAP